jgi:ribonuclease P protein component
VVRNRVRRRLNEAYRRVAGDLQGPADLVFIPAPATVDARFADLVADLRAICGRAGLKEGRPERGERSS